ncbi:MAG: type I DNA topoisomerase [Candidatus Gracilibacteria bacterium]
MKNLVIVESPAKGKTIEKYLGKDFVVKASVGHIRDLPAKGFGVDLENNFEPTYEISDGKKKVVTELKKLVKQAEKVWIATDEDREGEAIGWHLCQALGLDLETTARIVFHEITKPAITHAIEHPRTIDIDLVNAQQARRILDRIVGYKVSPVLWEKIQRGLSAGRVQSVAVRLIVEREREILAFVKEESWKIRTNLKTTKEENIIAELTKIGGKAKTLKDIVSVQKYLATLGVAVANLEAKEDKKGNLSIDLNLVTPFSLVSQEQKASKRSPGAPFTTSTLQQEASRKLGYSVSQTMTIAQMLYQNGHITYMRTDSVNLSDLAISACSKYIEEQFGSEYSVKGGRKYKTKQSSAQEAHEAIRPTHMEKSGEEIGLEGSDARLYRLIRERTIASQMRDAEVETTTYQFAPEVQKEDIWIAKGEVIKFDGFMRLYTEGTDDEETSEDSTRLPALNNGDILNSETLKAIQHWSKPPARYTEALLVKKLESEGIGRPSTYAPTITTIIDRGYVEKEEKRLRPTDIAMTVTDFLSKYFEQMMDYKFTANVEEQFDTIAEGKLEWQKMLTTFYTGLEKQIEGSGAIKGKIEEKVGRNCPECGKELVYKFSRGGKFVGCSGYPECKYLESVVNPKLQALKDKYDGLPCEAGGTIIVRTGRFGPFLSSSLYPEVKWIGKISDFEGAELTAKYGGHKCDKCGEGIMKVKFSKKGPFLACSRYPECKNAENLPKEALEKSPTPEDSEEK